MKLDYSIKYSDRKTFGISVERDKSIVVRVPDGTKERSVQDFVENKKFWIYTKLNHPQKYVRKQKKEFVSGTGMMYLGRSYKLDVVDNDLSGVVFNNKFSIPKQQQVGAYDLFKQWYVDRALEKLPKRVKFYSNALGVTSGKLKVSELSYRWGSCTPKNNLNLNWRIIKAPVLVIDYIIVHELAHLLEPNHTPRFWGIVRTQLPKYGESKEWLKVNGNTLEEEF